MNLKVEPRSTFTFMSDLPYIVSNLFTHVKPVKVYVRRHVKVTRQWKSTFNQIFWRASKHVLAWLLEIASSMKSPKNFFACLFSSRLSINSPWRANNRELTYCTKLQTCSSHRVIYLLNNEKQFICFIFCCWWIRMKRKMLLKVVLRPKK